MAQRIELTPELLLEQSRQMLQLRSAFEDLSSGVTEDLRGINGCWSDLLSNNFAEKIGSVQKSFLSTLEGLEKIAQDTAAVANETLHGGSASGGSSAGGSSAGGNTASGGTNPQTSTLPAWARTGGSLFYEDGDPEYRVPTSTGTAVLYCLNDDRGISCTYYTYRRLQERGLGFPFVGKNVGGGNWVNNCTDDVPKAMGADALTNLYNQYGDLENVVVDFPGHVVLVDKVFKNESGQLMVTYSDMWMDGQRLWDINGYNPTRTKSLDEFQNAYRPYNGKMSGAALIGRA